MELNRAQEIIRSLADGRDPITGQQFPPNSPYQHADTVRALHMAVEAMEKGTPTRAARPVDPNKPKAGASWTPEEEQQLRDAFAAQKPIPEIAAAHGRTSGGITARLVKLGLIEDTRIRRVDLGTQPKGVPPHPISTSTNPAPDNDDPIPF